MISFACDKCGKECLHKEEITSLQADLQDSKNKNIKLMSLYQESKEESSNLKSAFRIDLCQRLNPEYNNISSLIDKYEQLKINFEVLKAKYEMLESQEKSLIIDNQNLIELNNKLSVKETNTNINITIIDQDNQNQLNYLVSSMIYFLNDSNRIELLLSTLEKE